MRGARPRGRVSRTRGGSPPWAMGRRSGTEARWWQRPEGPPRPGGAGREGARRREAPRPCARRLGLRGPRGLAGAAAASRARTAARCPRRGRQGLREGRRRGSPPRSERQRGADAEPGRRAPRGWRVRVRGQSGQRRRRRGTRAWGRAGAPRGLASSPPPTAVAPRARGVGRRSRQGQGLSDSFTGDPAPRPLDPAPGRCAASRVEPRATLEKLSLLAPRPPENCTHSLPSPYTRTGECRLGFINAP